jgi:hypothetical protein
MELTEEERRRLSRPSFRMSGAGGRRPQGPLSTGLQGSGEAAATIGSAVLGSVPAGLAGLAALPFKGPQGAARTVEDVQEALTYVPRTQEGVKAVQGAVGPLSAMGAPAEYIGEKTRQATGSPALATAAEVMLDPLNLIGSAVAGKAAASGARAVGRGAKVAARELGPKAAEMAEGYMRRAGMMPQIFIGKSAKTWDAASNARAAEMEAAGTPPQTIWRETGNWRAPDGQWRQEISDAAADFKADDDWPILQGPAFRVLDHKELQSAYPGLAKIQVEAIADSPQAHGSFSDAFGKRIDVAGPDLESKRSVLLHELQHPIQEKEGFAAGANPNMFESIYEQTQKQRNAFNVFANLVEKYGDEVIRPSDLGRFDDVYEFIDAYLPAVNINRRLSKQDFEDFKSAVKSIGLKPPTSQKYGIGAYAEIIADNLRAETEKKFISREEQYFKQMGEAEARAVQARMNLTPEERRAKFPEESYDVPIGELIDAPRTGGPALLTTYHAQEKAGKSSAKGAGAREVSKAGGGAVEGGNMSFAGAADEIARKLISQGMSQDQAMMLALRMSDARMKAGGAVMMAGGGLLKGAARAAGKAAEKAETRLAGALKPQQAPVRGQTSQELRQMQAQQLTPEQQEMLSNLQRRYPDFGAASRFMTPQEIIKVVERPENAQAMNRLLQVLPESRNLAAVAKAGDPKRGWYRASTQAIIDVFGVDDAPRFSALLAAMSPQTSVEMNLLNTLNTWTNWNAAGRPTNPDAIKRIMGQSVAGTGTEASVLDAWSNNSVRALTAPDPTKVTLSGPKVDSFYRNLADDVYRVTNDAWMASGLGVSQGMFSGSPTALQLQRGDPGMSPGYMATSARMREAGQRAGILPAEAQETTWSFFMPLYEMQAKTGLPAREILQRGLLTPEQIRGTPDFSTLLSTGRYGDILRRGGYEEELSRLKPYEFGGEKVDLSLPEQREVERAAQRLEALRGMRTTESESRSISLPKKGEKPKSAFVTTPYEVIPGAGVGLGEGMVTAPFGTRANYSSAISSTMRDPMGRDRLQKAVGLNPLPTRGATGAFRPSGGVPFQGSSGRESFTQRAAMENQPAFGSTSKVQLTQRGDIPKDVKRRLDATEAARGYMTGQHGMTWNAQIPDSKGKSMFLQRQEKATPDEMGYAYNMLNDEGFVADTGAGVAVIHNEYMPNNPPFQDVEQYRMRQIFNPQKITPTRNVSNYIDFSEDWMKPQGSGSATRKLLGKTDELPPKERGALSREMKDISGDLYDIFSRREAKTGDPYRVDVMRALQILRDKGLPGLAAALAAGEALPSEEQRARGGLTALSR